MDEAELDVVGLVELLARLLGLEIARPVLGKNRFIPVVELRDAAPISAVSAYSRRVRGIVVALALMTGCYVYGGVRADAAMVVYQEPPAPKLERTPALAPGYVWVGGHWESHDNQWMWIGGRTAIRVFPIPSTIRATAAGTSLSRLGPYQKAPSRPASA